MPLALTRSAATLTCPTTLTLEPRSSALRTTAWSRRTDPEAPNLANQEAGCLAGLFVSGANAAARRRCARYVGRASSALAMLLRSIIALVALLLVSCATGGGTAASKLLGRWRSTNQDQTAEYVFAGNGTFSGNVSSHGATVSRFTGNWSVRDGAILYEYTSDPTGTIPVGTRDRDRL